MELKLGKLLDQINEPNDIKKIDPNDYKILAKEIRKFLVQKISMTGGHLASNLGAVELTMALHLCLDLPNDHIVWDVGHQSYTHKLLTGRKAGFDTLRQFGGMSGFPKRSESDCDAFDTGHSSTSISLALGMAKARDLQNEKSKVFAVIGDGALSGGMAFEALNNAARLKSNLVIVLNDNQMSISKNVGGMSNYLGNIRTSTNYTELKEDVENRLRSMSHIGNALADHIKGAKDIVKRLFVPGMLFEDMGITYIGPIDGHDVKQMVNAFENASKLQKAVIVHVCTKKGKGYLPAENDPSAFHGVAPFKPSDGSFKNKEKQLTYTSVFSKKLVELADNDEKIVAISAAMPSGTGLSAMAAKHPDRFFDVGIAEEHAVTFAAGMAASGIKPVVAIYSTFFQRAYDQILHDVCIGKIPVVFAVDRAGLVGSDGETHQGIFDISYFNSMPNMTLMAPKNVWELEKMLEFAVDFDGPIAVRYPRGKAYTGLGEFTQDIEYGKSEVISNGGDTALIAVGSMVETAQETGKILNDRGINVTIINARFIKPLDEKMLSEIADTHQFIVTMEEGVLTGGFGQSVSHWYQENTEKMPAIKNIALPDKFIEHGSVGLLKKKYGIDALGIAEKIVDWRNHERA
ncbi:1-deoxy-D-xylulose-5-phosphate synthase [Eubacterium sp. MSJ-13]|uniref:1-deoxy-D-xylulose-5-phosphate synthase n=1 Tax=Eubacterium sp. MSJ-13 TaxID=2841513 RepID=UPI001C112B31|nr:1-deoxy-D-xylulose-5-phosphate synthase [Eubacterium sp. MSJ-13]MBU5479236.1 1-deoxy-D-xylulose-5-phosphate synthase [Eubacterium sp. MSJ-13]